MDIDMDPLENETINDDTTPLLPLPQPPRETSFIDESVTPVQPKTTTTQRVKLISSKIDQLI